MNENVAQVTKPARFHGSRFGNLGYIFEGVDTVKEQPQPDSPGSPEKEKKPG